MPWPLAIVAMVFLLAGIYYYRRLGGFGAALRERGYKSPALKVGLAAIAFGLPPLITLAVLGYGHDQAIWLVAALYVALPLLLVYIARRLPATTVRTSGRRELRFPYRAVGYTLFPIGVGFWIAGAMSGTAGLFQIGTVSIAGALGCVAISRRAAQPDAGTVLAQDPRPPVIYLRPFQQEEEAFAEVPWSWSSYKRYLTHNYLLRKSRHLTLEDFLGAEISRRLGPFIALGNPADFVPPAGAARTYVGDDEWPRHFATMVRGARGMILFAASSEHVMWELKEIRSLGLEPKLFVLTRPRLRASTTIAPWSTFANSLRQAGYPPCGDDAGPGAVVGFKPGGEMVILKRNAKSAAEMVDAIARRLP